MTPYELVRRAIEFERPRRLPMQFGALGISDTFGVGCGPAAGWEPSRPNEDEWGCVWHKPTEESGVRNMGQPKGHPLTSWELLDEINFPDPDDDHRYAHIEEALEQVGDRYVLIGCGFTLFERMHYLRGFTELLADMHAAPERVHELAERVLQYPAGVARNVGRRFRGRIHGMSMTDDWGTQQASIISIPMWREFFKDRYRRLYGAIHEAGMHAWMHSCGHVNDVIEEWIDCGLDVINLQQPRNLGIEEIGCRYRGRICFLSLCDIQMTLPLGTEDDIRREAALLLEHWSTPEGGFILGDYGDGAAIGVSDRRKRVMLQAFCELAAPEVLDRIPAPVGG
ncbi:MAG: uroporphyrinogen decarboxylase family protein [Armatimonadota bacterium]|nr:uroporphyrinogen decarboxylase family protein [Armatimonadota bacterium]